MSVLPPLITALPAKATLGTATRGNYLFAVIEGSDQGSTSMADAQSMGRICAKKELPIPTFINNYNHFMGGVDLANQFREAYKLRRATLRT